MKKYLIAFFFIVVPVLCSAAMSNDPSGFRDLNWGTDISTLKGMAYVSTDDSYGGIKLYSRNNDVLTIGAAKVESIQYGFWQNKLSDVRIIFKGYPNFASIKDATFEKFGTGDKPDEFMERYLWTGEKTGIVLQYSQLPGKGSLFMWSQEISKQQKAYQEEKAKEGSQKGF